MSKVDLSIGERKLANGLSLLAVQNKGVHTFAAGCVLAVDMRDEGPQEFGVASMVGDCLEEGTLRRDAVAFATAVDEIGGTATGSSSGGTVMCPAKESTAALALLRELVFEPAFPEREVERVRDETLQEIKVAEADPHRVAGMRFREAVYGDHPYARSVRGTAAAVASHDAARLAGFHRRWWHPAGGYVAAAGPLAVDATLDLLEAEFGALEGEQPEHVRPAPPGLPAPGVDVHAAMDREQVHIYVGHPGVRRTDPDYYALLVMDYILGTGPGFTSRIAMRLRDEMGLCYSVNASITQTADEEPGTFAAYIGTSAEHRETSIAGFMEEIVRIRETPVTAEELRDVQDYLTGSYVFAFERNAQLAQYAVRARRFDLGFDFIERYPDLIRSVTVEDVQRVAREHLHPENMVRVSAGATQAR